MGGLNWLPCRRRRRKEKKKAEEARREKEKNEANPPKTETTPDAGTKAPEPAKPAKLSAVEQTTPSPTLSISQDVWNEAYESIAKEEPKLVESYMKALTVSLQPKDAPTLEAPDVSAEMNDPVKRQETMQKLVASGREKVATASKVTQGVGDFANSVLKCKGLVDLAIQNIPQAALPWAGVCVGLQILCNPAKESSSNLGGIAHVTSRMDWYCSLTEHILSKEHIEVGKASFEAAFNQLRGRTVGLYKALLLYQMRSACTYYRNQGLNFIRGLVNLDDWDSQLQSVKDAEASLIQDSEQYNTQHTRSMMGQLVSNGEATQNLLGSVHQTLQDYIVAQKTARMDDTQEECLRDLRVVDPQDTIVKIEGTRDKVLQEAYDWILSTEEYQAFNEWSDKQAARVLWVHGPAGTGKTMLMIGMIRELSEAPASTAPAMSYFFCQSDDDNINNPTAVLRSLIWLLLIQQPHLFSHILQDYKSSGAERFRDANAFWSLSRMFKDMLRDPQLGPAYLMVDALDECSKKASDEAKVEDLKKLISESLNLTDKVKWLITSRPEVRLDKDLKDHALGTLAQIDVQGRGGAVQAYINHKLSTFRGTEGYDDERIKDMSREINKRANNIFLWVALVFRQLATEDPWNAMNVICSKPSDLVALYDNLMSNIEEERESTVQFCKNVLVATCLARRPLSLDELGVCAGLARGVPAAVIAGKCGSFLAIREDAVYLIHQSAREYLEANYKTRLQQGGPAQGHAEISQRSIHQMSAKLAANMYSLQPDTLSKDIKPPRPDPLASIRYSCEYWAEHLCAVDSQSLQDGNLLSDNGEVFAFLQNHLLHWLESLSLAHNFSTGVRSIKKLLSAVQSSQNKSSELVAFLKDAEKFVFRFRPTIEGAPLQIYGAPLAFSPNKAKVKEYYWKERLPLIKTVAGLKDGWDPCLQTLEHGYDAGYDSGYPMEAVAFSPDGKTLAVTSALNVRLWDTATGFCKKDIKLRKPYTGFSPDSKTLTLVSPNGDMQIWDLTTAASNVSPDRTGELWDYGSPFARICISPDGYTIARGSDDGTLEIWNAMNGASKKTPEGHGDRIVSIAFSPDGKKIASAAMDSTLRVWDAATTVCTRALENPDVFNIHAVSFSPDGKTLASASHNGIHLWNIDTGDCKVLVESHRGDCIAFSPDGRLIASDSMYGIKLFNAATGAWVKTLEGHTSQINSLAFSPDSQTLASASEDFKARVWDATVTASDPPVEVTTAIFENVALSPDGKTIALGTGDTVQLRDAATGVCTRSLQVASNSINTMAFSPDGKTFATTSWKLVQIWDLATGNCNHKLEGFNTRNIAFSSDSKLLAAGSFTADPPHAVKLLDVATGEWAQTLDNTGRSGAVAFSPDGNTVAALASGLMLWDAATGTRRGAPLDQEEYPSSMRYSDDGRYLVTNTGWMDPHSGKLVPISTLQREPTGLLFVEGEWVTRDGQKVLWLPSEYKSQRWAASNKSLVFMNKLGQATVLEFV